MKVIFAVLILFAVLGLGFAAGLWYARFTPAPAKPAVVAAVPPKMSPQVSSSMAEELRIARQKAFEENPELATEYQQLLQESAKHEEKIEAAMVSVDPQMAPLVAKLAVMRQQNMLRLLSATK